ncbi:hypothetical protein B7463_g11161, partial [Scytalidium lignicola]
MSSRTPTSRSPSAQMSYNTKSEQAHTLNCYLYSPPSVQERLRFELNTASDLNKRNFEIVQDIEKLQKIIEEKQGNAAGQGKL